MKVKELIQQLQALDQEAEIRVLIPLPHRPLSGDLEPIHSIDPCFDQDTNELNYVIDTGIGKEGRLKNSLKS